MYDFTNTGTVSTLCDLEFRKRDCASIGNEKTADTASKNIFKFIYRFVVMLL